MHERRGEREREREQNNLCTYYLLVSSRRCGGKSGFGLFMNLQLGILTSSSTTTSSWSSCRDQSHRGSSPPCVCSKNDSSKNPNGGSNDKGDKFSTDWDKSWSSFKKQGKMSLFSQFNPSKYVSWNPKRSNYPLSEEIDPIKRAERSNLMLWTSPKFTLAGANVVVSLLLIYTLLALVK